MNKVIGKNFFARDTVVVAKDLIGKFLVSSLGDEEVSVMIYETEAYDGISDLANHASKGKTERTKIMFGPAGNFYIYLVYGMYYMLNVVTREKDYPAAVLIRGGILENGKKLNGPGKLTKFLKIGKTINGQPSGKITGLWFEDRVVKINNRKIKKMPRVGVNYAGPIWSNKKWRFLYEV